MEFTAASRLYESEARDDRIKPSVVNTLYKTLEMYSIYTIAGIIMYVLVGMPLFDSINATFTTISTGGMSIKNANIGAYNSNAIYLVTIIIMIIGSINFSVHYKAIKSKGNSRCAIPSHNGINNNFFNRNLFNKPYGSNDYCIPGSIRNKYNRCKCT